MRDIVLSRMNRDRFFGMLTGCSGLLDDVRPDTYILNSKITVEQLPLLVRGMYKRMLGGLYGQGNFGDEIASDNFGSLYSLSAVIILILMLVMYRWMTD